MALANLLGNNASVLLGDGDGTFAPQDLYGAGLGPGGVVLGDLDGDGDPDMDYPDFKPGPEPAAVRERREQEAAREERSKQRTLERQGKVLPRGGDESKFPGGVVPTKLPPKRMGGRISGRR